MNARTLCLAVLFFGEASGYEIRKLSTDGQFSYFVDASFGAIYPALNKLESDGLIAGRLESQTGKPAKKMYAITDSGRAAFLEALTHPPAPDVFRSEFLLIAMCVDLQPRDVIRRAIDTRFAQLQAEIDQLQTIAVDCDHPGTRWVVDYGITCMTASLRYLEDNRASLEALAAPAAAAAE
ncbi:MAG: PadR family transcriptional regulator [Hyphomicrobiales bacterium]